MQTFQADADAKSPRKLTEVADVLADLCDWVRGYGASRIVPLVYCRSLEEKHELRTCFLVEDNVGRMNALTGKMELQIVDAITDRKLWLEPCFVFLPIPIGLSKYHADPTDLMRYITNLCGQKG